MSKLRIYTLVVITACCLASVVEAQTEPVDTADLYDNWRDRVVQIQVVERQSQSKSGIGSGFLAGPPGFIISNYHVIADLANQPGEYEAWYLGEDGRRGLLQLVNVDVVHDLALLKSTDQLPAPLAIAQDVPRQGTRLYSMGFPYDIGLTIVEGTYNGMLEKSLYERMHFTGSINPGMSGGPVLNQGGEVIGINVATAGNQVGFLVPAKFASQLLADSGTEPATTESLHEVISQQLQANQSAITDKLLSGEFSTTRLKDFQVAGELADWMSCWGNSLQNGNDAIKHVYYHCQSQDDIFLSGSLSTGVIRFQHDLLSTDRLHPMRFYHQLEKRSFYPQLRLDGTEESVTRYQCQSGFMEQSGMNMKSVFCVRAYHKLPGIYDAYLYLTSLVEGQEALQTTLVLAGFDWENLARLSETFVGKLAWEPSQP
jgi:hypothetical protein